VDMFAASTITWHMPSPNKGGIESANASTATLTTTTKFPFGDDVVMTIMAVPQGARFALHVRVPNWLAAPTLALFVNGVTVLTAPRGTYGVISRVWATGDVVSFQLAARVQPLLYEGQSQLDGFDRYSFT
jgi:DUF1680 family protein